VVVLKFGGTSVGEVESIRRVAGIIAAERRSRVVVVSALAGVTDALLSVAAAGATIPGNPPPRNLDLLLRRHIAAAEMVRDRAARVALEHEFYAIGAQVAATLEAAPGRLSAWSIDEVAAAGELWSSRLLAAVLRDRGLPATWLDARDVMRTNSHNGGAAPDLVATREACVRLVRPQLDRGDIVVLGGFIGSDAKGATTTLGRGGSDCSAAVFGACLGADEIQIWTDVDGIMTADPRLVPHARLVPHLSYDEAHDLASFGARVLHPGTIAPAVDCAIPVVVRNSQRPHVSGTVVGAARSGADARPVASLASRDGAILFEVIAHERADVDEFVSRVFGELELADVEAVLADLCGNRLVFTVQAAPTLDLLRRSLGKFADVRVTDALATVTVVGEGLSANPHLAADAAGALRDLHVHLVAQPDGRRTLSFVVDATQATTAVSRLHDWFFGGARRRQAAQTPVVQA
jgi:aspartate kinase